MLALLAVLWIGIVLMPIRIRLFFHLDADPHPDPDPDWRQNNADSHADPTSSFTQVRKLGKFFYLCSQLCKFTMFFCYRQWQMCHDFKYFEQHIEIS